MENLQKCVHFVLQGKGGVGKSFLASLISQYVTEKGEPLVALDTDPNNRTFTGYKALNVQGVDVLDGTRVNERKFDAMMELIMQTDSHFVVDNGASSFIPLSNYLVENSAIEMLTESGKVVVIHAVVTGGQAMLDTLQGLDSLARQLPESARLIVWLNEYFGPIEHNGLQFEDMKVYLAHKERIHGIVRVPKQSADTFGTDIQLMLEKKLTFAEVAAAGDFGVMARQRLTQFKRAVFQSMDVAAV
jgi:hypothetical protein